MLSMQMVSVGLAVGGSTVVVVPVEAPGVEVDGAVVAGADVDGSDVAGADVDGSDVAGAELGWLLGSTVGLRVDGDGVGDGVGADVAGAEVDGSDVAGLPVGVAVAAVVVPPPQAQHMSSSVKPTVSKSPLA